MEEYASLFILCIFCIVWTPIYYFRHIRKRGKKFHKSFDSIMAACIFLFFIGFFIFLLQDITSVLKQRTMVYKGRCEVEEYTTAKTSGISVLFGDKYITFDRFKGEVKDGQYDCRVEYYPKTEIGYSLELYESNNGSLVKEIKN